MKTFEEFNNSGPQIGDWVLGDVQRDFYFREDTIVEYINNHLGRIIDINNEEDDPFLEYQVEYEDADLGVNLVDDHPWLNRGEIIWFGSDPLPVDVIKQSLLYNI